MIRTVRRGLLTAALSAATTIAVVLTLPAAADALPGFNLPVGQPVNTPSEASWFGTPSRSGFTAMVVSPTPSGTDFDLSLRVGGLQVAVSRLGVNSLDYVVFNTAVTGIRPLIADVTHWPGSLDGAYQVELIEAQQMVFPRFEGDTTLTSVSGQVSGHPGLFHLATMLNVNLNGILAEPSGLGEFMLTVDKGTAVFTSAGFVPNGGFAQYRSPSNASIVINNRTNSTQCVTFQANLPGIYGLMLMNRDGLDNELRAMLETCG
jgi:hypothetical protein